jgi:outer membrane protein assembly factor BamB/tetratricopeptide (TPR) repeat protein
MKKQIYILILFILILTQNIIAQTAGTIKWSFLTGNYIYSSPSIGSDGTIYVGSLDNYLYAINSDGSQKWKFSTGNSIYDSPALGLDGTIYVGSYDNYLYAINTDGTQKWRFLTGDDVRSSPAIGLDGTIYVGSNDNYLYAINPDGTQKWKFLTGNDIFSSSPGIGLDGTIYIGSTDRYFYAINPDGTQKWRFLTGDYIASSPSIGSDGTIYFGSEDKYLYAINPDGTQKWKFLTGAYIISSPAIGSDGTIYIGSQDKYIYAINPDGTQKWKFLTGDYVYASPAIGLDGIIYVGSYDNYLYAINPDGTQKWNLLTVSDVYSSPAIGSDGSIYFGSNDKYLYTIYSSSMGLASSPWPKFRQNNKNTGIQSGVTIVDNIKFSFTTKSNPIVKIFNIVNLFNYNTTLNTCSFTNPAFILNTILPLTIDKGSSQNLEVQILPDSAGVYRSNCKIYYTGNGKSDTISGSISTGIFLEDGSETALVGHRALAAYDSCYKKSSGSIATQNNLGVLYRLLKEIPTAETKILSALSSAINAKYGYSGIKMNMGVVKSDKKDTSNANIYYNLAYTDLSSTYTESSIVPQINYNKAWEYYNSKRYSDASTEVNKTINHLKTNNFLQAKAYVLRGVINYQLGKTVDATNDFLLAKSLDPDGPIGKMAQENLSVITYVEDGNDQIGMPKEYTLMPNYPNPFNSETIIRFGLPGESEVEISIYNILGQRVRILNKGILTTGWHITSWNGTDDFGKSIGSGIYIIIMKSRNFYVTNKMMLLK